MKLNSFKASKVHSYLNYDISFFNDLTFLIGINGSGKTSALKLILGLASPSYYYLNQIAFEYAELICSSIENEKDIIIRAEQRQKDKMITISLKAPGFVLEKEMFPRFIRPNDDNYNEEEVSSIELAYKEQFDLLKTTKAIRELTTPKFLGLDRKIYEGKSIDSRYRFRRNVYTHNKRKIYNDAGPGSSAIDSSLEDVQAMIFEYIRVIATQQPKISEEFKNRIFQLSFNFIDDSNIELIPENSSAITDKMLKVQKAIRDLDISYLDYNVKTFFSKMEKIALQYKLLNTKKGEEEGEEEVDTNSERIKVLSKWFNNSSQLKRIDEIINFSQTYQKKIAELRSPIKKLEQIIEYFFKEGRKVIQIADDGEIKVKLKNGRFASIYELSSGEKQIIIMIAHLIFEENQKPSGIFIIDEPEISLHIAWQEIFVKSIMEASPKTQFILATHSPSIISNVTSEKYCQDLNKLNY